MNTNEMLVLKNEILNEVSEMLSTKIVEYNHPNDAFSAYSSGTDIGIGPLQAVVGRMLEKQARLNAHIDRDLEIPEDIFLDIIGGCVNAIAMLRDGIK